MESYVSLIKKYIRFMIINIADRRSISNYRLHDLIGAGDGYTLDNLLVTARITGEQ